MQVSSCISVQVFSTLTVIEKQPQYLNEQNEQSRYTKGWGEGLSKNQRGHPNPGCWKKVPGFLDLNVLCLDPIMTAHL